MELFGHVATGPYSARTLSDAGADVVFEDLSDTEAFMSVVKQYDRDEDAAPRFSSNQSFSMVDFAEI
jgi:hypothetical protein